MDRESRYLVIKKRDVTAAIDAGLISFKHADDLDVIAAVINDNRERQGKDRLQCVVVESDWPEYKAVWSMIEARVDGTGPEQPIAEVVSKFGDPESFGEREIKVLVNIQKMPYNTKLYTAPPLASADTISITKEGFDLICQAIGGHAAILQFMTLGRHDLALEEAIKWVGSFAQAPQLVASQESGNS
jgi:hypothetical protein